MPPRRSIRVTAALKKRASEVLKALRKEYPDAHCELDFSSPLELAVGCILSAQCTDKRVNAVTPDLFKKYRSAADWAHADPQELEQEIRSTGFFRNKARNLCALGQRLEQEHHGRLPEEMDELICLPGIGRKTANVLLASAFDQPGVVVDTHCKRVSSRLGLTKSRNPDQIEFDLKALLPEENWTAWSHAVVFHGRRCCYARTPECDRCVVKRHCKAYKDGDV